MDRAGAPGEAFSLTTEERPEPPSPGGDKGGSSRLLVSEFSCRQVMASLECVVIARKRATRLGARVSGPRRTQTQRLSRCPDSPPRGVHVVSPGRPLSQRPPPPHAAGPMVFARAPSGTPSWAVLSSTPPDGGHAALHPGTPANAAATTDRPLRGDRDEQGRSAHRGSCPPSPGRQTRGKYGVQDFTRHGHHVCVLTGEPRWVSVVPRHR